MLSKLVALALLVVAIVVMLNAKPLVLGGINGYQQYLAPHAADVGIRCRFTPSCSHYAQTVIARDGVVRGGWLALKRIARCGPWTPQGTIDLP